MLNEANLKDAVLQRVVFTRSDLGGANIEGADFSNALLDKLQQQVRAGARVADARAQRQARRHGRLCLRAFLCVTS